MWCMDTRPRWRVLRMRGSNARGAGSIGWDAGGRRIAHAITLPHFTDKFRMNALAQHAQR